MSRFSSVLVTAVELLDFLDVERNSPVVMSKDIAEELKLKLRFLITCLNYIADGYCEYENLRYPLSEIEDDVGQQINKLHALQHPRLSNFDISVRDFLGMIEWVQLTIRVVVIRSSLSRLRLLGSFFSNGVVAEFVDSLLKVLRELPESLYSSPVVISSIRVLEQKLRCIKYVIILAAKRCNNNNGQVDESVMELVARVEAMIHYASYLAFSMVTPEMDLAMEHKLRREFFNLAGEIDPAMPKGRGIFRQFLKTLKSSQDVTVESKNTYEMDETAIDFVDLLSQHKSSGKHYRVMETFAVN